MKQSQEIDLVILAGGKGSRIANYIKNLPKPLIKFNKIHFINYLINFYSKYNFKKIYILTGYLGKKFDKFNGKSFNLISTKCIKERKKLDTGGAIYQLKDKIKNKFLVINGDSFVNFDVNAFIKNEHLNENVCKILLVKNTNYKSNNKLSNLKLNQNNKVTINGNLMNAGVYLFDKKIFNYLKLQKISLESQIFPKLIENRLIKGFFSKNNFLDIGTYTNLKKAKNFLKKNSNQYSVFLDRDGVINVDKKYVYKIKDFSFRKNVISALKFLNKKKFNIFIITNQAGIAKGYYTERQFLKLSNYIKKYLTNKNIFINDIEYCPFHPTSKIKKYCRDSNFRKPGNLMIKKIIKNWGIKSSKSFMIGDSISDKIAANKSFIHFEYVEKDILKQVKEIIKKLKFNNYS
jgi:D,D-heptose 1,7-bisphosphate phosphatase